MSSRRRIWKRWLGGHSLAHLGGQRLPHANEFADGSKLHLTHDVAAVEFDGDLTDAKVESDPSLFAARPRLLVAPNSPAE